MGPAEPPGVGVGKDGKGDRGERERKSGKWREDGERAGGGLDLDICPRVPEFVVPPLRDGSSQVPGRHCGST